MLWRKVKWFSFSRKVLLTKAVEENSTINWQPKPVEYPPSERILLTNSLSEYLTSHPLIVHCPNPLCSFMFENAGPEEQINQENSAEDGEEVRQAWSRYRFRCRGCNEEFCSGCGARPYHTHFTCEQHITLLTALRCRFCKEPMNEVSQEEVERARKANKLSPNICSSCTPQIQLLAVGYYASCSHPFAHHFSQSAPRLCYHPQCVTQRGGGQNEEEDCCICHAEPLAARTIVTLDCGHVFHYECVQQRFERRWEGAIQFGFCECPLCLIPFTNNAIITPHLTAISQLKTDLLLRVQNQLKVEQMWPPPIPLDDTPLLRYALSKFNYYLCSRCNSPYYGGKRVCDQRLNLPQLGNSNHVNFDHINNHDHINDNDHFINQLNHNNNNINNNNDDNNMNNDNNEERKQEYICLGCKGCSKHGAENMRYKCRFCCSVASWYCFGHTHFCEDCHNRPWDIVSGNNNQYIKLPLSQCNGRLTCPLGIDHPPNGEEFPLGCVMCEARSSLPSFPSSTSPSFVPLLPSRKCNTWASID